MTDVFDTVFRDNTPKGAEDLKVPGGYRVDGQAVEVDILTTPQGDITYRDFDGSIQTAAMMCFIHACVTDYMQKAAELRGTPERIFTREAGEDYITPGDLALFLVLEVHDAWHDAQASAIRDRLGQLLGVSGDLGDAADLPPELAALLGEKGLKPLGAFVIGPDGARPIDLEGGVEGDADDVPLSEILKGDDRTEH